MKWMLSDGASCGRVSGYNLCLEAALAKFSLSGWCVDA